MNNIFYAALAILITVLIAEKSKYGGLFVIVVVLGLVYAAKQKGKI
jgi:hypothetical protein